MKILHLIKDEKFIDSAYELFEAVAPGQNVFMLAGRSAPITHLRRVKPQRIHKYAFFSPRFIKTLESYDAIIIHSLHPFSLEILARLNRSIPVVWIGMGYDYYDLLVSHASDLLKPRTRRIFNPLLSELKKNPLYIFGCMVSRLIHPNTFKKRELIRRIDFFAPVIGSEYALLKKSLGEPFPAYVRWNYGNVADLIDGKLGRKRVVGRNVLIGNSAYPENNHIDVFHTLANYGIPEGSEVIVPLSYGDPLYRKRVIAEGHRLFGNQFKPITEFMELNEYIDLLSSCSSVLMNHLRQQAVGNILIAMYLGARVYLDTENPLFEEFKAMGLEVHSLGRLDRDSSSLDRPVAPEVHSKQQDIIRSAKGRAELEHCTKLLISGILKIKSEKSALCS